MTVTTDVTTGHPLTHQCHRASDWPAGDHSALSLADTDPAMILPAYHQDMMGRGRLICRYEAQLVPALSDQ